MSNTTDTTPPSAPTNLSANPGKRKVSLSWTASSDNVGVTGYEVWRSTSAGGPFTRVATTVSTAITQTGLTSGTTYYYYVTSYDAAGNVSAASTTVSARPR